MTEFILVNPLHDGKRLDVILTQHPKIASRTEAAKLIKAHQVTINHSTDKISPKRIVNADDQIEFNLLEPESFNLTPQQYPLEIIHEDADLIVINKPKGVVVHPSAGHAQNTLVNYLLYHAQLSSCNLPFRPGIVHRLDKDTSGTLVVAKTNIAHENLAQQFASHTIKRIYHCLVWGDPPNSGVINQPVGRHKIHRKKQAINPQGKKAITHWKKLHSFNDFSLLECQLETGRTHQIRVHLSAMGFPLIADTVYGRQRLLTKIFSSQIINHLAQSPGQLLHASVLGFFHPITQQWLEFQTDLPDEIQMILKEFN